MGQEKDVLKNFSELKREVESNGGVLTVSMDRLRNACDVRRLGKHVVDSISSYVERSGMKHYPVELPLSQGEPVRLYSQSTTIARVIEAVLRPSEDGDEAIKEYVGSDAEDVLSRIRDLVCK